MINMKRAYMFLFIVLNLIICDSLFGGEKIKIVTGEWAPYVSKNMENNGIVGEIVREAFKEEGINVEFVYMPWKRGEIEVKKGNYFGTFPYITTEERKIEFEFSNSIFSSKGKFFYLKNSVVNKEWHNFDDLREYKIGGTLGYWYSELFKEKGLNVDYVVSDEQNFMKLYSKRVDIVPTDEIVGEYIIDKLYPNEKEKFDVMDGVLNQGELKMMVSKSYPGYKSMLNRFNAGVDKIKTNGKYKNIIDKYRFKVQNKE